MRWPNSSVLVGFICFSWVSIVAAQATHVVPSSAYSTIQQAIIAAVSGDTIQVLPGTYYEQIDFLGKQITVSGAGPGTCVLDGQNLGSVVTMSNGETAQSILEEFTITGGAGTLIAPPASPPLAIGGGVLVGYLSGLGASVTPTIRYCHFIGNTADIGSAIGGIYSVEPIIEDCRFELNSGGSAIGSWSSRPFTVRRCVFENNTGFGGAAIGASQASPTPRIVEDCVFVGNMAIQNPAPGAGLPHGGAIVLGGPSVIRRCRFIQNSAANGGAIGVFSSSINVPFAIENCLFEGNLAAVDGGAIYISVGQQQSALIAVRNCTAHGNVAGAQGGGLWSGGIRPVDVVNCVAWGNVGSPVIGEPIVPFTYPPPGGIYPPALSVFNSNIEGGWTGMGSGNIDQAPLFENEATADFRLRVDSPCIDTGTGTLGAPMEDIDGRPRPLYAGHDMGAYESGDIALDPSAQGTIVDATGAPVDLLFVNGSSGGVQRRVDLSIPAPLAFHVLQPPLATQPVDFVVFGMIGTPQWWTPVPLGPAIGTMSFMPCPLLPSFEPLLFTLASTVSGLPCTPAIPATLTPWSSGVVGFLNFPVTFALQAIVVTDNQGSLGISNVVTVRIQ